MIIQLNCGLKKAVWDGIKGPNIKALTFRTTQGAMTQIISYYCVKFLPLTIIAVTANLAPIITVVIAFLVLKEKVKNFEIIIMILSLAAIIVFVLKGEPDQQTLTKTSIPVFVFYIALGLNPFLQASGTVAMRKMKKFHMSVVAWYLSWMLLVTSLTMILVLGEGW